MLGGQPNQGWQLALLFNLTPLCRILDSMTVLSQNLSIDEMVGA